MPRKVTPTDPKPCERCGVLFNRKRFRLAIEDLGAFRKRQYCSLRCANSRGVRSLSSSAQHRISQKFRKPHCEQCGKSPPRRSSLHAHHINKDWTDHRSENLLTLCVACHLRLHNTKPKGPCRICGIPSMRRGFCGPHYRKLLKSGTLLRLRFTDSGKGIQ